MYIFEPLITWDVLKPSGVLGYLRNSMERYPLRHAAHPGTRCLTHINDPFTLRDREVGVHCCHRRERHLFRCLHRANGNARTISGGC
jgi:hypothetical protein